MWRSSDCLILEPTQLMMINYPDAHRHHSATDTAKPHHANEDSHFVNSEYLQPEVLTADYAEDDDSAILMSMLEDSTIDSDSEDVGNESYESVVVQDKVHEILEKSRASRTDEDIEVLLDFMQNLPAFNNMTLATRHGLCAVMEYRVIDKADTVLYKDGDVVNSWSVILNGLVELIHEDGTTQELRVHDSFGSKPTRTSLIHRGTMRTLTPNCQLVDVAHDDYFNILHQGEENTKCLKESGQTVLITEKRTIRQGAKTGDVIIRGTPEKLTACLVEDRSAVDPTYVEDFLLTYRTFLDLPMCVADKLAEWFRDSSLRDKVIRVVLLWVNNHFRDFELESQMADFLDDFMKLLEEQSLEGQLLLLRLACSANSHCRSVELCKTDKTSGNWPPFDMIFGGPSTATLTIVFASPFDRSL
jgi:Rap guanine nucleotide exchange factor 2